MQGIMVNHYLPQVKIKGTLPHILQTLLSQFMEFTAKAQTTRCKCKELYIGETELSLKTRFLEHKRPSSTSSEVSNHIHIESPGHHIDLDKSKSWTENLAGLKEESWRQFTWRWTILLSTRTGPVQTSRSLRVYSQVKCTKGHDLRQTHSRW